LLDLNLALRSHLLGLCALLLRLLLLLLLLLTIDHRLVDEGLTVCCLQNLLAILNLDNLLPSLAHREHLQLLGANLLTALLKLDLVTSRILHVLHDDLLAIGGVDHLLALTGRDHLQALRWRDVHFLGRIFTETFVTIC